MEELKLFEVKIAIYFKEAITYERRKVIIAKSKEEAKQIFEAWKNYEKMQHNNDYRLLDIKIMRRSKRNEHCFKYYLDEDYYKQELELLKGYENEQSKENI